MVLESLIKVVIDSSDELLKTSELSLDAQVKAIALSHKHITRHANLLNQPLELWMVVPCVDGVPIEEPTEEFYTRNGKIDVGFLELANKQYQKAKDRVLFEGFTDGQITTIKYCVEDGANFGNGFKVEDLHNILQGFQPTLTPTAIKMLKG